MAGTDCPKRGTLASSPISYRPRIAVKNPHNKVLLFALCTFAVFALAALWPFAAATAADPVRPSTVALQPLLIMALLGAAVAATGFAIALALPPASDVTNGLSCYLGLAVGGMSLAGMAFMKSTHPGTLAALLLCLTLGITWIGKRLLGSSLGTSAATLDALNAKQARGQLRPEKRTKP